VELVLEREVQLARGLAGGWPTAGPRATSSASAAARASVLLGQRQRALVEALAHLGQALALVSSFWMRARICCAW
jgi:hypothetical protein